MISNPIKGVVLDNEGYRKDTYYKISPVFSKKAYNFQPADCGLSQTREANLLFFAVNESHALARLKRMLEWYIGNNRLAYTEDKNSDFLNSLTYHRLSKVQHWLDNWDKVKVIEVPLDQFFLVGWAGNDTLI